MARFVVMTEKGVKITVAPMAKPRKFERTWSPAAKYSIYNMGAQGARLGCKAARVTCDRIG